MNKKFKFLVGSFLSSCLLANSTFAFVFKSELVDLEGKPGSEYEYNVWIADERTNGPIPGTSYRKKFKVEEKGQLQMFNEHQQIPDDVNMIKVFASGEACVVAKNKHDICTHKECEETGSLLTSIRLQLTMDRGFVKKCFALYRY